MDKLQSVILLSHVVGGGHSPYFGLNFNCERTGFDAGGGGDRTFFETIVEPLIPHPKLF